MQRSQVLELLLWAESLLKQTRAGYLPDRPFWKRAMPALWEARLQLGDTADGLRLAKAHGLLKQTEKGYDPRAPRWREAMRLVDRVEARLVPPPIPDLGPCVKGGKPVLLEAPTHETDGLFEVTGSRYPAFDFGWDDGIVVIAPEPWRVRRQSSAMGADAYYATGASGIEWWLGHIVSSPATGTRLAKGDRAGVIAAIPGADHGHLALDVRKLIGRDLRWGRDGDGPDYTYGAATIGHQLRAAY